MGLLDELKRLTKPYGEDEDFYEEVLEEPVRAPQRQPDPRAYAYQEQQRPEQQPQYRPQAPQPQYQPQYQPQPQYRPQPQPQPQRRGPYALSQPPAAQGYGYAPMAQAQPARMLLYKPERFDAAREIAERLQERNAVVLNLENTPPAEARRLVDFLTGVAFALNGQVKKVSGNTCVITPAGMDVMGEGAEDMESREQYL